MPNKMRPIHPGEILKEEYLGPLGMSATKLALALRVNARRINDLVRQRRAMTKAYSGKFNVRVPADLHEDIASAATADSKSLNQWVVETLKHAVHS